MFLPNFFAILEGFFWDALKLRSNGPLDSFHTFKTSSFDDPLQFEEKQCYTNQDEINREFAPNRRDVPLGQDLPAAA